MLSLGRVVERFLGVSSSRLVLLESTSLLGRDVAICLFEGALANGLPVSPPGGSVSMPASSWERPGLEDPATSLSRVFTIDVASRLGTCCGNLAKALLDVLASLLFDDEPKISSIGLLDCS